MIKGTPKEYADNLLDEYSVMLYGFEFDLLLGRNEGEVKDIALKAVEKILDVFAYYVQLDHPIYYSIFNTYFVEVKQEIETR